MTDTAAVIVGRVGIAGAEKITGLERSTIYRKYRAGQFPEPEYIGERRTWRIDVLQTWVAEQLARPRDARRSTRNAERLARAAV